MFGSNGPDPECPIDPDTRAWIDRRWAWLVREFGGKTLRSVSVILPTPHFFPAEYAGTEKDVRVMLDQVCEYMRVDPGAVELALYDEGGGTAEEFHGSAGRYVERNGSIRIGLEVSNIGDPLALVATMAHELGHVHLIGGRRVTAADQDHEPLTDLLTVFLGLGVISANSVIRESNWQAGNSYGWSMKRQGYFTMPMFGYALALFTRDREEDRPAWVRELRGDVRAAFDQSVRYLERGGDGEGIEPDDRAAWEKDLPVLSFPATKRGGQARSTTRKPRCRHCGAKLKLRGTSTEYCSRCKRQLRKADAEERPLDADTIRARKMFKWGFIVCAVVFVLVILLKSATR